jgi:hypothetical protein
VGLIIMARAIRSAIDDGVPEFRMLRGGEAYKFRFANRDPGVETLALPLGPLGAAVVGGRRILPERAAALVRQWVNG